MGASSATGTRLPEAVRRSPPSTGFGGAGSACVPRLRSSTTVIKDDSINTAEHRVCLKPSKLCLAAAKVQLGSRTLVGNPGNPGNPQGLS